MASGYRHHVKLKGLLVLFVGLDLAILLHNEAGRIGLDECR